MQKILAEIQNRLDREQAVKESLTKINQEEIINKAFNEGKIAKTNDVIRWLTALQEAASNDTNINKLLEAVQIRIRREQNCWQDATAEKSIKQKRYNEGVSRKIDEEMRWLHQLEELIATAVSEQDISDTINLWETLDEQYADDCVFKPVAKDDFESSSMEVTV